MDGGAWWATVHGVAKIQTRLSDFNFTFTFIVNQKIAWWVELGVTMFLSLICIIVTINVPLAHNKYLDVLPVCQKQQTSPCSVIWQKYGNFNNLFYILFTTQFSSVQFSRSVVSDSATPCIAARQASLSITNSRSSLRLASIQSPTDLGSSSFSILSFYNSPPPNVPCLNEVIDPSPCPKLQESF